MRVFSAALLFSLALAPAASAGDVRVALHDGRVDLVARDAALSQVLAEWARVGQVRIVNGERVPSGPVTIELRDVPEAAALDVLLRSASGFIAVPRDASTAGPSRFARILILPSSAAPAVTAARPSASPAAPPAFQTFPAPTAPRAFPAGAVPVLGADGRPVPDDQEDAPPPVVAPPPVSSMPPGFAPPPQQPAVQPAQPGSAPMTAPGSPVPGAAVPGMVVQPGVPGQPAPPKRPQQ